MKARDNVCCEHRNCYINFDLASKDPDIYTYFVMDKEGSDNEEGDLDNAKIARAAQEDRVYIFCKIHSESLLEYIQEHGEITLEYMERIIKDPHFGGEDDDTLIGNILGL